MNPMANTTQSELLPAAVGAAASGEARRPGIGGYVRGPVVFGTIIVVAFFGVFGAWAALMPLASGALAPGIVSPDSSRRVVQHLEGGIIAAVHVREGQQVAAGQPLMTLESTRAEATFASRRERWLRLLVTRSRLEAQATRAPELVLPREVLGADEVDLAAFVENQRQLLDIRRTSQEQQLRIFERQVAQVDNEIMSMRAENQGLEEQIALLAEEIASKQGLLDRQLIARSELLVLQRQQAQLRSAIAANEARIARADQSIEETRLAALQEQERFRDQVAEEMTQVNAEIAQIDEDMVATGDVLRRTEITSPINGIVLNLRSQTAGGVIRPGEPIMDIVPLDDDLIIVARLAPRDIDVVKVGLEAQVILLPFASRNALPLVGEVIQLAADSSVDEVTGESYYEVRVEVAASELARQDGIYLSPGMPADVTVVTGERTMLAYLLDPFLRSLRSAFVYD